MKYISAAVVAAAVLASSAVIADVPRGREPVSINVSTAGLDLTTQRGRNALRVRMDKEIAVACNPGGRLNADFSPDFQCRGEMAANARPTLLRLATEARTGSDTAQ